MIENTASGTITAIGLLLMVVGGLVLYTVGWVYIFKRLHDYIDDWDYIKAGVLAACLVLYTGAGVTAIGLVI